MPLCTSFSDCVGGSPLPSGAEDKYGNLSRMVIYFLNFFYYLLNAVLIIFVLYSLTMGVYKLIFAKDEQTFEVLITHLKRAIFGAVGIVVLLGARFMLAEALTLVGIPDDENIFIGLPFTP
jgi:hypothetical protein